MTTLNLFLSCWVVVNVSQAQNCTHRDRYTHNTWIYAGHLDKIIVPDDDDDCGDDGDDDDNDYYV